MEYRYLEIIPIRRVRVNEFTTTCVEKAISIILSSVETVEITIYTGIKKT
jgi:hypothetical protein